MPPKKSPQPESHDDLREVPTELHLLREATSILEDAMSILSDRLQTVTPQVTGIMGGADKNEKLPPSTAVGLSIREITDRVTSVRQRINYYIDTVQL